MIIKEKNDRTKIIWIEVIQKYLQRLCLTSPETLRRNK